MSPIGSTMDPESALRVGRSSVLPSVICHNFSAKDCPWPFVKLSRAGHPRQGFERRSTKTSIKGDFVERFINSGKLFKTGVLSLWLPEQQSADSRRQSPGLSCVNAVETMRGDSPASSTSWIDQVATADRDELGLHSVVLQTTVADERRLSDALLKRNDERMRELLALAALRHGRILDSRVYRQTYVIRSYEVSADGTASIDTILNLFQELAQNHVSLAGIAGDGFGATIEMNRYRLIWVLTRLHVEVERYPSWPEVVEIDSWMDSAGKNGIRTDWLIREHDSGEIIARATSTWVTMNQDTRGLSKLPDDVRTEMEPTFVKRHALGEMTLERIPKLLNNTANNIHSNLSACTTDLDGNQHVNNVTYARWVMQITPSSTLETHELHNLTLEFRRECNKDDIVESLTDLKQEMHLKLESYPSPSINSPESSSMLASHPVNGSSLSLGTVHMLSVVNDGLMSCLPSTLHHTHLLRMQFKGDEIVRGRTVWKPRRSALN